MIIPVLKFCHKTTLAFFEILGAFALILLLLMCIGFWKFSQGPVDVTFAADAIKRSLISSEHKTDFKFDSIVAEWPEFSGPISVGMSGVKLIDNNKHIMNIPQLGIRIAKAPLLIGLIHPEAVIVKDANIKLIRSKNGGVRLLVNDTAPTEPTTENQTEAGMKEFGEALFLGGTLPNYHQIEPLSKLERFSVENAHLFIVDEEKGMELDIPTLDFEILREKNQFTIVAHYQEADEPSSNLSFLMERSKDDQSIRFYSEIDKINVSTLGRLFFPLEKEYGPQFILGSKVEGLLDKNWTVLKLDGDLSSDQGQLNLDSLYQAPLKFSDLKANISYDSGSKKIVLKDTHIKINNRTVFMKGEKNAGQKTPIFDLNLQIPELTMDEMQSLWPDNSKDTVVADWLTKRLTKAKIKNLNISIPVNINHPEDTDAEKLVGSFDYENLMADYNPPMFPVTEANGKTTLKDDTLTIDITSGKMGGMDIEKGKVIIPHLTHPTLVGNVTIDADVTGKIEAALNYIRSEPINLGDKIGLNPSTVKGITNLNVKVSFPALKELPKEQVVVVVDAILNDVTLPSVVRGMNLTGGPYQLVVKGGAVTISGKGALGGQPIDLNYTEYINPLEAEYLSSIKVDIIADKALREKFGVHLDQFVEGDVPVKIEYQQKKNLDEVVNVDANLTPAIIKFSPFKYRKKEGQGGQATCNVLIQKGEVRYVHDLQISIDKSGQAVGNISFGKVGNINDVKTGKFLGVTLAGANNFALEFTQTSPDVFDVNITGKQLDARPFLSNKNLSSPMENTSDSSQVNAIIKVSQMKTGDDKDQILLSPDLTLKTSSKGDVTYLDLNGRFDGGNVSVSLKPNATGKSELQIKSENAGGALRVLDIYDTMIGGVMDIRGTQISGGGVNDITGRGTISNFTIVKAPFLAKLINLFSLSGLSELLQDRGIEFKSLKTDFEWKESTSGRVISLKNGRTTGASIGLTFGGLINQDKGIMDLSGTFVPMSEVNGIVSKIPLIGNLLTGGKNGGIIAATYAMNGKTENPNVFLNPLSVLTPGFLRSILFENNNNVFDDMDDSDVKFPQKKKELNN
jgi:hypothetical protein